MEDDVDEGGVRMVAKQEHGHAEVMMRSAATSSGTIVEKVPNGQVLVVLDQLEAYGEYAKVQWREMQGFVKKTNLAQDIGHETMQAETPSGSFRPIPVCARVHRPCVRMRRRVSTTWPSCMQHASRYDGERT